MWYSALGDPDVQNKHCVEQNPLPAPFRLTRSLAKPSSAIEWESVYQACLPSVMKEKLKDYDGNMEKVSQRRSRTV